jgi:hypothetical protein
MTRMGRAAWHVRLKHSEAVRDGAVLLLVCAWCLLVTRTSVGLAQRVRSLGQLPPFEIDPSLPGQIVLNAEQGLGLCHWLDPDVLSHPYVGWAYDAGARASGWSTIEPQDGLYSWAALDEEIRKARTREKRIWLEVLTSEGLVPQWARDAGVQLVGSFDLPVPWNETYLRLLRRVVHAMAARYDENPTVDAIILMPGGCYGEMTICNASQDEDAWLAAGYSDAQFVEAVKQIIDIYLEEDYQWEDGSHTHGFRKTPVVLQLGGGLYGPINAIAGQVLEYAMPTYGMRVWLKYNGLGGSKDMETIYSTYGAITRVGYEPVGTSADFLNRPEHYIQLALDHHSSYLCLQRGYFALSDVQWQEAREMAARYLGAQIVHQGIEAPSSVRHGQEYVFATSWVNRGTVPLMYGQRQGTMDIPASYDILIAFVRPATGVSVFEHSFTPAIPTTNWYSAQTMRIEEAIAIPVSVPVGEYDLRIALVRPDAQPNDPLRCFRLVNADLHDGSGRYTVGRITVLNQGTPPATSTATATQTPSMTPTGTGSPSHTPTATGTLTPTATLTPTIVTPTLTVTGTATRTPTLTATRTRTATPMLYWLYLPAIMKGR